MKIKIFGVEINTFNYQVLSAKTLTNFTFYFLLSTLFFQTRFAFFARYQTVDYLIPFVYFSDVLIVLLLFSTLIWQRGKLIRSLRTGKWSFLFFCFSVFLFSTAISNLSAIHPVSAWYHWLKFLEFGLFAFWIGWYIREKSIINHQSSIINFLSFGLVFQCLIAIAEFILQRSLGLQIFGEWRFSVLTPGIAKVILFGKEFLRPYATFPHPNVLGGILAIMAPVSLHLGISRDKRNKKYLLLFAVCCLLFTLTLLLTFSRSAWVAYGALMVLVFIFWGRRGIGGIGVMLGKRKSLLFCLSIISCFLFTIPFVYQRLQSLQTTDVLSVERRVELNRAAISMFWDHPLFGVGLGNFVPNLEKHLIVSGQGRFLQPVHNVPLLILAETGIVGFLIFCVFIIFLLYSFVRSGSVKHEARNSKQYLNSNFPNSKPFGVLKFRSFGFVSDFGFRISDLPIFLMWLGIFITSFFDHYWWTLQAGQLFFWLTVGLTI